MLQVLQFSVQKFILTDRNNNINVKVSLECRVKGENYNLLQAAILTTDPK